MSRLGDILEEEIRGEIDAIRAEGDSRSGEILRKAEGEASARLSAHRRKIETEARAATRRAQSAAELTLSTARLKARGQVLEAVRQRTLDALKEISLRPDYTVILRTLAEEARNAVDAPEAIEVHPDNEEHFRDWATRKGLQLRTDPAIRLGVRIVSRNGRTVTNTLPERLNRAWDTLVSEVARILWQ